MLYWIVYGTVFPSNMLVSVVEELRAQLTCSSNWR